jgi:hypothetical protein
VAILYFFAEEPIPNRQQQDCCLIVEVYTPDRVDDQWVQQAAENAIKEEFGKALGDTQGRSKTCSSAPCPTLSLTRYW